MATATLNGVEHRTRAWDDPDGSSNTVVQFRTDGEHPLYVHTNLGWLPIGYEGQPDLDAAEIAAEQCAAGYHLTECDERRACWYADWPLPEPPEPDYGAGPTDELQRSIWLALAERPLSYGELFDRFTPDPVSIATLVIDGILPMLGQWVRNVGTDALARRAQR